MQALPPAEASLLTKREHTELPVFEVRLQGRKLLRVMQSPALQLV